MKTVNALLIIFYVVGFLAVGTYANEYTHQTIYNDWNCEDINITVNPSLTQIAETKADCTHLDTREYQRMTHAHQNAEAVAYHVIPTYAVLGIILAFSIVKHKQNQDILNKIEEQ